MTLACTGLTWYKRKQRLLKKTLNKKVKENIA
jgi:hypothetical protein